MAKYINADALVNRLDEHYVTLGKKYGFDDMYVRGYGEAISDMEDALEADAEEVRYGFWILVDGGTGVCPFCNRQDHIDPLAKYCRYCGARLEKK